MKHFVDSVTMKMINDEGLTDEEKEDLGLLILMQEADVTDTVSQEEIFNVLLK